MPRQGAQEGPLDRESLVGHGGGLGVDPRVDLQAPRRHRHVRIGEVDEGPQPDEQVGLGIADEMLDDALRLGVAGLAEVGPSRWT